MEGLERGSAGDEMIMAPWPGRIFIPCPLVIKRGNGTWKTNFFLARKWLINWIAFKDLSIARFSYWTVWFKTCWLCFGTNQPGHALRIVITLTTTPPRWLGQQWAADHGGISRYIGRYTHDPTNKNIVWVPAGWGPPVIRCYKLVYNPI